MPKKDIPIYLLKKEESKQEDTSSSLKQVDKKFVTSTGSSPIVLRYIPKSRRKDGESSFKECIIPKDTTKADVKCNEVNSAVLRENGVLSVHKAC